MNLQNSKTEHKLNIDEVLHWLVDDLLLEINESENIKIYSLQSINKNQDLVEIICNFQANNDSNLGKKLTPAKISKLIATKTGMPYINIDPLKINMADITSVCTRDYAEKFNILPIKVDKNSITVAVSEPFIREWEKDLIHVHKIEIKTSLC